MIDCVLNMNTNIIIMQIKYIMNYITIIVLQICRLMDNQNKNCNSYHHMMSFLIKSINHRLVHIYIECTHVL